MSTNTELLMLGRKVVDLQELSAKLSSATKARDEFLGELARATKVLQASNLSGYDPPLQLPTDDDVKETIRDLRQLPDRIKLLKSELGIQEPES